MNIYKPTWLYIKQHNLTGLKYFGKTTQKDPIKYKGSGVHWTRHLEKHGNNVTTIWCQLFENQELLTEYALNFSIENKIVESKEWANMRLEDGLMGGRDSQHSQETKRKMAESRKKQIFSEETKKKMANSMKGRIPWNKGIKTGYKPAWNKGIKMAPRKRFILQQN